jgi:hypothetical protein
MNAKKDKVVESKMKRFGEVSELVNRGIFPRT